MAFKMKNSALAKKATMAGCPRTAMKMQAESAMKKMHSPAKAMKTPMKKMDAPTKAMKESATKFNAELKKASAEGKLKGKFKEAVDSAPMKKMNGGKKTTPKGGAGEAGMTKQDRKIKRLQKEIIKARDEGNDRRITEIYKEMREMYEADKNKSPMKEMRPTGKLSPNDDPAGKRIKRDDDRKPKPRPRPAPRPKPRKIQAIKERDRKNPKQKKQIIFGESATKRMKSPTKAMKSPMKKDKDKATGLDKVMYYEKGGAKLEAKEGGTTKGGMKYYITQTGDAISANHVKQGRKFRGRIIEGRK